MKETSIKYTVFNHDKGEYEEITSLYLCADFAEFFLFAATGQKEKAKEWLDDFSNTNLFLRHPESDSRFCEYESTIEEAIEFLQKFAENWIDNLILNENRYKPNHPLNR
tara:strand:+ start:91 stop:417 length:327 start_codon:yes stop_codon:yes gene_type:complete